MKGSVVDGEKHGRVIVCTQGEQQALVHILRALRTAMRTGEQLGMTFDPFADGSGGAHLNCHWSASGWQREVRGIRKGTAADAEAVKRP